MAINVPKPVLDMLNEVGMTQKQAMWNCHGTWVMYHKSLEKLAAYKKLKFEKPELIHQDLTKKEVVLLVTGHRDGVSEWSYGEATPSNNKNAYPFAMAEKRAKDRVILKLLGFHGDVYSDAEIDSQVQQELANKAKREKEEGGSLSKFSTSSHQDNNIKKLGSVIKVNNGKPDAYPTPTNDKPNPEVKKTFEEYMYDLDEITSDKGLDDFWRKNKNSFQRDSELCTQMMKACSERRIWIQEKNSYLNDLNKDQEEQIDGETIQETWR